VEEKDKELFEKILNKAYHLLSFRPRAEAEIRRRLQKHTKKEVLIDKVVERLRELNLLNDHEFVRWWVEERQTFRPKGKQLIELELKRQGIKKEIIDEVLGQEGASGSLSQVELARQAIKKKISLYKNLSRREFRQKVGEFLARRGFDWETIGSVIDSLKEEE